MLKLIVLYPPPLDAALFERRYREEHVPMVRENFAGLRKFVTARVLGTTNSDTGAAPYQRVTEISFDSSAALQAAMTSQKGQATVAHAIELSTGGPPLVLMAEEDT